MFTEPFIRNTNAKHSGWIEVVCGPMFSGKTEELMRRLRRAKIAQQKIELFKPAVDTRYHEKKVVSHDESEMESHVIKDPKDMLALAYGKEVVGIDEVQFFDKKILDVVRQMADKGLRVIVAGLDKDYKGIPFGPMPELLASAEFVTKLQAICVVCGAPASFSYRLDDSQQTFLLGSKGEYQARCRNCFNEN